MKIVLRPNKAILSMKVCYKFINSVRQIAKKNDDFWNGNYMQKMKLGKRL